MRRLLPLALLVLFLFSPPPAAGLDIPGDLSSCGIHVRRGDPGVLQGDLDCSGSSGVSAITLRDGAKLSLNGHRIVGPANGQGVACWPAVAPALTCTIEGPGQITGARFGIAASSKSRIRNLTVHGNEVGIWVVYGDVAHAALVDLKGVTIRDNAAEGIMGGGAIRATDTAITNNGGVGTTSYGPSRLVRTSITGNGGSGVVTGRYSWFYERYFYTKRNLILVDTTVSGNGLVDGGVDILSGKRPRLLRSSCGTSADPLTDGAPSWGVCAGD